MNGLMADAANIRDGANPPFTLEEFKEIYPQFKGQAVPDVVLSMYLEKMAMGLFIAHFATLWAMGTADAASTAADVVSAGEARGLVASKSVRDLSVSYDFSAVLSGLDDCAAWNMTKYGAQLVTLSRMISKGGMQVW